MRRKFTISNILVQERRVVSDYRKSIIIIITLKLYIYCIYIYIYVIKQVHTVEASKNFLIMSPCKLLTYLSYTHTHTHTYMYITKQVHIVGVPKNLIIIYIYIYIYFQQNFNHSISFCRFIRSSADFLVTRFACCYLRVVILGYAFFTWLSQSLQFMIQIIVLIAHLPQFPNGVSPRPLTQVCIFKYHQDFHGSHLSEIDFYPYSQWSSSV